MPAKPKKATCPNCGKPCTPVSLGPDTPPWVCYACRLGWWQAEVDGGKHWDRGRRGFPAASGVRAAVKAEHAAARDAAAKKRGRR